MAVMGRPKFRESPSVPVSTRVDKAVADQIDSWAEKQGVTRSIVIQKIINDYVEGKKMPAGGRQ